MATIESITYSGSLPENFFQIPTTVYAALPFSPDEDRQLVSELFQMEQERNDVVLFTDHESIRLAGIFPHNSDIACFGFWETADDSLKNKQAFALLEAAAKARHRTSIIGPINFNTFHNYRLRLGAAHPWPMFDREPVNPYYYPHLLRQMGFQEKMHFESRYIQKEHVPVFYADKQLLMEQLHQIPFDFIPLHAESWRENEAELFDFVQAVFGANPLFQRISRQQFQLLYNPAFAQKLCPHSSVLFRDKQTGNLAAMSFCHPMYQHLNLADAPVYERDFHRLHKKVLLVKTVGVHPNYRKKGLMGFLGAYSMISFSSLYDEVIFCLMRSGNFSLHFSDGLPYQSTQYALFEKLMP
jgi:hypothetical protein